MSCVRSEAGAGRGQGVEDCYADRGRISLVGDNLLTHTSRAFYGTAELDRARAPELPRRVQFGDTPKGDSWLTIAECEPIAMAQQSMIGRRIRKLATLQSVTVAWATDPNQRQRGVDWPMITAAAGSKLQP